MHEMHELKEMLEEELKKITKQGKISTSSLDVVDKLTHAIKSIETIMAMRESGYSNRAYGRGSYDNYSNRGESYGGSYDGYSNRIRQDGMRDQRYNYSRDDYSNRGGYSREDSYGSYDGYSQDLKHDLEGLMHRVHGEGEQRMIKKWIKELDG